MRFSLLLAVLLMLSSALKSEAQNRGTIDTDQLNQLRMLAALEQRLGVAVDARYPLEWRLSRIELLMFHVEQKGTTAQRLTRLCGNSRQRINGQTVHMSSTTSVSRSGRESVAQGDAASPVKTDPVAGNPVRPQLPPTVQYLKDGSSITVIDDGCVRIYDATRATALVRANNCELAFHGSYSEVVINGNGNRIAVSCPRALRVSGNNNVVVWTNSSCVPVVQGQNNSVQQQQQQDRF